ncbi:ATP-binding protein [Amycolatopsis sp. RTGN1]|uniref:ATP-binding protein n=1 Tax=Amycolatopsis ponsaeliensis TaxID=2992142 RepID=UPI00254D1CBC|nr:ATP-binding protein [Amycolatopsis sp. RTGN1]
MDLDDELTGLCRRVAAAAEITVPLRDRPDLRQVRTAVMEALTFGAHPADNFGGVLLVMDELVSNAYRHTSAVRRLRVTRAAGTFLIEVSDHDPVVHQVRAREFGCGAYGLRLVAQLSLDWGVRADSDGKVVWAIVPIGVRPSEM